VKQISETYIKKENNRKKTCALFECPDCKNTFDREVKYVGKRCVDCSNRYSYIKNKRLHNIWAGMKARATNPTHRDYPRYGGRGIFICDEWKDYKIFQDWALANGYDDNLSIDRINNNDGYYPNNCRWVTQHIQSANTRLIHKTNSTGYRGVCTYKGRYRAKIQIDGKYISLGYSKCALECAYMYDKYVIENKLHNPTNIIPKDYV